MAELRKTFTIINENGFHARPAAKFVTIATQFSSRIEVEKDGHGVNAKSILGLLTMEAYKDSEITVVADGDDADQAIAALGELIERGFDDE